MGVSAYGRPLIFATSLGPPQDKSPHKINLGVGAYRDNDGKVRCPNLKFAALGAWCMVE